MARWLFNCHITSVKENIKMVTEGFSKRRLEVGLPQPTDSFDQAQLNAWGVVGVYEWVDRNGVHLGYGNEENQ